MINEAAVENQTNAKKLEKIFLNSKEGWELTFNAIPDLITILDRNNRVIRVNKTMAERLNRYPHECIGFLCYEVVHNTDKPPKNCPNMLLLNDGIEHCTEVYEENLGGYFIVTASPIKDDEGNVLGSIHIAHDITARKKMEEKLKKTIEEKDTLMKEVHHRVKNNLMIISSLLSLQSRYIKDKDARDIFKDSQNRAKAMALIHEKLYQSNDLKNINFTEYVRNLSNDLYDTYVLDKKIISLKLNIENVRLDVETSIPLGLILNELLTNALKHAFPDERKGEILVELESEGDGKFKLIVSDNGIGFPEDLDYKNTPSLGMQLVNSLTDQIEGELHLHRNNGTSFTVIFRNISY